MRGQQTHVQYNDINWSVLRKLVPYLLRYPRRLALSLALLIAAKIASVGLPFILKHIVDALDAGDAGLDEVLLVPLGLLVAYGLVRLANVLFAELRDTVFGRVTEHAMHDIALRVFKHLHALDLSFHLERKTGGLARDIERGTTGISFLLRFMVFNIVPTLIEIIMVIVILSGRYSVWFGVIVFAAIVLYIIWSVFATEIRTRYVREMNEADSSTNSRAIDSLLNYETVKYFGNEDYEARRYDVNLDEWEAARRKNRLSIFALNGGQAFVISVSMSAAMILAAYEVSRGAMTLGDFVLINAFMMQIFLPLNFLGFVYREMKGALANIEKMFSLLSITPNVKDTHSHTPLHVSEGTLQFKQVSFSYSPERPILKALNFDVAGGKKVALVGSSGSGKSTLAKLLFRFYDCDTGGIYIDGHNIQDVSLHSLRAQLGFVPQDAVLFNDTIEANIRYGKLDASEEDICAAIRHAKLEDFIHSLPEGRQTIVGERGLKLSGGEKQRIAIARTMLKNPPILIFDEATSSLDNDSEAHILQAIDTLSEGKTCLVIAHRLSTIKDADWILVLENGQLVEQGSHDALLEEGGRYATLWQYQHRTKDNTTPIR